MSLAAHPIPQRLGKFKVLGLLGKGSMGVIYEGVDFYHRPVALKIMHPDLVESDEDFVARLRNEARAARKLDHPGIVSVYEYGVDGEHAYIAMECLKGRSLKEYFESGVAFSVAHAVDIQSQLLDALQHAHDRGIWHRDIRPANLVILRDGQVKVTDFGIARIESSVSAPLDDVLGTPGFVAPEMYLGDTYDSRVDLFAAGAVLYQLLVGAPAYLGAADKVMFQVCYETPVRPSIAARRPSLEPFDAVVLQALAKRPEDRFASAGAFQTALLQAQAGTVSRSGQR
jgi:serine/threonine protein kinase